MIDLYVVESPLQALSAAEAKSANGEIVDNVILIKKSAAHREINNRHLSEAVSFGKWENVIWLDFSKFNGIRCHLYLIWSLLNFRKKFHKRVRNLYLGEFRAEWMHYLRCVIDPVDTFLLDDGAVTLTVQRKYLLKEKYWPTFHADGFLKNVVKKALYSVVYAGKVAERRIHVFTSFDLLPAPGQRVVRHSFEFTRSNASFSNVGRDVYYFGAKYSEAGIISLDDEIFILKEVLRYYTKKNLRMIYVPHRDDSSRKINILIERLRIPIRELGCPAELFFVVSNYRPCRVAAAYSSVLNNLRLFWGEECCDSFIIPNSMVAESFLDGVNETYDYYRRIGINLVSLNCE